MVLNKHFRVFGRALGGRKSISERVDMLAVFGKQQGKPCGQFEVLIHVGEAKRVRGAA